MRKFLSKIDSNIWLVLAFSIFAWGPLLTPAYFFNAHDAKHSVFFLVEFDQTFRDGFLWPRWSPDFSFGYGYPLFNLYAPLAFYAAEMVHLLGLGFTASVKVMYVLATVGAGLGMYGFVKRLFGSAAGLVAAVVYMYVPFHLVEIFVRSAYAEFVALALIPLLFWAFTKLIATPQLPRVAVAGLSYGLLALTHHTTFYTFTPFLMVYILYLTIAKARFRLKPLLVHALYTIAAGMLGVALAAIYLIPVLAEMRFVKVEQWTSGSYNYLQHFVYFSQFFSPEWGYGYAGAGLLDDFSYQLGIVVVALVGFALVSTIRCRFPHRGAALFFLLSTLAIIFLMSPLARPVWQVLPIAALVQFPWRLLGMTAFTLSIGASSQLANYKSPIAHRTPQPALYLLCLVVILASFPYTLPQYTEIPDWAETPLAVVKWDRASIVDRVGRVSVTAEQPQTSPMESQYLNGEPLTVAGIIAGSGQVETLHHGGGSDAVRVAAAGPVTLQFYTYDYPGWRVTLDGQPIAHRYEPPYGLITVDVPAGEHTVVLRMGSTPARTLGTVVSGVALLIMMGFLLWPALTSKN
ncbi:MAG: glycosyltransferase family 39 protein [Anaerolineae bacterium]|nr:glycosyltransferase family 39 protein [Anaerolineae bacterium]